MMSKADQLFQLAKRRQQARWEGFANIADFHEGKYDCDYVSPWTKSAANHDSSVMLVAQDWAGADYLNAPFRPVVAELGYDPSLDTNINLQNLLRRHLILNFADVYATNLFPLIKVGGMSAGIPAFAYRKAALEFVLPQINIIRPKAVICIGAPAFRWTAEAFGKPKPLTISEAIANPIEVANTTIYAVAHTGRLGMNNRGRDVVEQDWAKLAERLN